MDRINPDKLREYLPNDVLNVLSYLTGPHIQTLLSKEHRDSYFREYMICVNYGNLPKDIKPFVNFLRKYSIYLKKYPGYVETPTNLLGITDRIIIVDVLNIYDLSHITKRFPNVRKILGHTFLTLDNLDTIKKLGKDMVLSMGITEIPFYKKMDLTNLIILSDRECVDRSIMSGIEDRLYHVNDKMTTGGKIYPNLQSIIVNSSIYDFMDKKLKLPNLRTIYVWYNLHPYEERMIREKYSTNNNQNISIIRI